MSAVPEHGDLEELEYWSDELGVRLTCYFEYEPEQLGSTEFGTGLKMEPDYPATFTLMHIYLPGSNVDIAPVLLLSLLAEIEEYAQEEFPRRWQEERDSAMESMAESAAYDRWLDRQ